MRRFTRAWGRKCGHCFGMKTINMTDGTVRECPTCGGTG